MKIQFSVEHREKISKSKKGKISNFKGHKHSEETKRKLSKSHKGKKLTNEHKIKIGLSHKGEKNNFYGKHHTDETKIKMRLSRFKRKEKLGYMLSPETRKKLSLNREGKSYEEIYGKKKGEEVRNKIRRGNTGKKHTEDSIRKAVETRIKKGGFIFTEEQRRKISLSNKGKVMSEEAKKKIGLANKGKHASSKTEFKKGQFVGEKSFNWQGGKSFEPYSPEFNANLKEQIRKRDNHRCQICNSDGKQIHHIDYNKKNNSEANLINLCRKCHAKTSNSNRPYWEWQLKILNKLLVGNDI